MVAAVEVIMHSEEGRNFKCCLRKKVISSKNISDTVLWEGEVVFGKGEYVSYIYKVKWTNRDDEVDSKGHKLLDDVQTQRDTWKEARSSSDIARTAHIIHIMDDVDDLNLKLRLNELYEFYKANHSSFKLTDRIKIYQVFKQKNNAFQVLYFFFLTLVPFKRDKFDQTSVQVLLTSCNESNFKTSDFPLQVDVAKTVIELAKVAELSWMDLLSYTYNFLDAGTNLVMLETFRNKKLTLSTAHTGTYEAEWKKNRQKAIVAIGRKACIGDAKYVSLFTEFLGNMNDMEALENYAIVVNDLRNKKGFPEFNNDFRALFIKKLKEKVSWASNECNMHELPKYWELVNTTHLFEMEGPIKRAINHITFQKPKSSHQAATNAESIEQFFLIGVFEKAEEQMEILECIARNYAYYRLVPVIIRDYRDMLTVTEEEICAIILMYLDKSFTKKEAGSIDEIQTIFEDFGAVSEIEFVCKKGKKIKSRFDDYVARLNVSDIIAAVASTSKWTTAGAKMFYGHIKDIMNQKPELMPEFSKEAKSFCRANADIKHK